MEIIEVKDLVKDYGGTKAVDNISFSVAKGEVFGFIGPNGAGKTTTINILCTMLKGTSGSVRVNGIDVQKDPNAVRRSIGIVFQEPTLDIRLTGFENLEFHGLIYGMPKADRRKRIKEVLDLVELSVRQHENVRNYSGGMKRRLEIARGLMHHPQILFLDEPTWGLDPQTRARIWDHIFLMKKENDLTVFMTTHYLQEAEACSNILIIDHGKIIASGTPEGLKKSVRGDLVILETNDDIGVIQQIKDRFGLEADVVEDQVIVEVENAATFVPQLLSGINSGIRSVSFRQPSLDDVFLKLTGRKIREEHLDAADIVKEQKKFRRRS